MQRLNYWVEGSEGVKKKKFAESALKRRRFSWDVPKIGYLAEFV